MIGIIGLIEQSKTDVTIVCVSLFVVSLCILAIFHFKYFGPKYLQGYSAIIFLVLFFIFIIGYQRTYEVNEYKQSYEKINIIKDNIESRYDIEYIKRFDQVNDLIISSLGDNKITPKEHDYIMDKYLLIVLTIEEEVEASMSNDANHKQKLKSKL